MNAKPIIFNGPMVRSLIDGRKLQTRRVVKPQPSFDANMGWSMRTAGPFEFGGYVAAGRLPRALERAMLASCPYGKPGDLLWVRETASRADKADDGYFYEFPIYRADFTDPYGLAFTTPTGPRYVEDLSWRPSIHMPRCWSRLTLRITDVRVERVQEISEADARNEGLLRHTDGLYTYWSDRSWDTSDTNDSPGFTKARNAFARLWDSIYAKRGNGWDENPWVWALTFEVIHANVDDVLKQRSAA